MSEKLRKQFEQFNENDITQLVSDPQAEGLHIEFKSLDDSQPFHRNSDKKNLAKTLSAFANTGGGITVWGIHDQGHTGERFQGLDPTEVHNRLNQLEAHLVNPQIPGVQHRIIGKYVATFVPESDSGPHMAIGGGAHDYFMRSGESSVPMEHQQIADMFGRRPHPKLIPELFVNKKGSSATNFTDSYLVLHICNLGRGIAKHFMVRVGLLSGIAVRSNADRIAAHEYNLILRPTQVHLANVHELYSGDSQVIHPGTDRPVVPMIISPNTGDPPPIDSIKIHLLLACENMPATEYVIQQKLSELSNGLTYRGTEVQ